MVTVAIAAILLAVTVPSFSTYIDKRRVDGAMGELSTDFQLARSEAVSRGQAVRITFGTNCYIIHLATATVSCTATTSSVSPSGEDLKTVQLSSVGTVTLAPANGLTYVEFRSQLGNAAWNGSNTAAGVVNVSNSSSLSSLRISVGPLGRTQICSPGGVNAGVAAC